MLDEEDDEAGRCPTCGAAGLSCQPEEMRVALTTKPRTGGVLRSGQHGGITVRYRREGEEPMHTLATRTYVNRDSTKVVDEGSPDAAFLLGNEGDEISAETAERLGLTGAAEAGDDPYKGVLKADLVKMAEERGLDSAGTVADLRSRLEEDDEKAKAAEVGAGGDGSAPTGGTADVGAPDATASVDSPA